MARKKSRDITLHPATVSELRARVKAAGSYRKAARELGIHHATIWNIVNQRAQDVSLSTENRIRALLGLTPRPPLVSVPPCPDCGSVHHGRCHGKPVALRVVRQRDYTMTNIAALPVGVLAQAIRGRVEI